jgi:hypothetical protein
MSKPKRKSVKAALKRSLAARRPPPKAKKVKQLSMNQLKAKWRTMHIKEHRNAIAGVENMRARMGDKWADNAIAWRVLQLKKMGVRP